MNQSINHKIRKKGRFDHFIHIEILQNGEQLAYLKKNLRRRGTISLYSDGKAKLSIPFYPLPNGRLDIFKITAKGVRLIVEPMWEGFSTSNGELINLNRNDRGRREIDLEKGDYVSISRDDLRIIARITDRHQFANFKPKPIHRSIRSEWRGSALNFLISHREERYSFIGGTLAAAVILCSLILGLGYRNQGRPNSINEIKDEYMLSFVAPTHLETAPEILQNKLNRSHFVQSVFKFYQAFTNLMIGTSIQNEQLLLPSSIDTFRRFHLDINEDLQSKIEAQKEIDRNLSDHSTSAILNIPSVIGESLYGKMLRTLDKIQILQKAASLNLKAKQKVTPEYNHDEPYDYENYRDGKDSLRTKKADVPDAIKQIKVWTPSDSEEIMYQEAHNWAKKAELQQKLNGLESSTPIDHEHSVPLGLPQGSQETSFISDIDLLLIDEKIANIHGAEWGADLTPKKVVTKSTQPKDTNIIESYIKSNRYQLQLCYELALRRDPVARGTMEWYWKIDSRGNVSNVNLIDSNINDQTMIQCISRKIFSWRFPRPARGDLEITYPFEFLPSKG